MDPKIEKWVQEGLMTPEGVLNFLAQNFTEYHFSDDEKLQLRQTFDKLSTNDRLNESGFLFHLRRKRLLPPHLAGAGSVLYRSLLYLSQFPFDQKLVESLTFDGLVRALSWTDFEKSQKASGSGSNTRTKTPADCRRIIFQSLATTRDGAKLLFDVEKARKESHRRAFELTPDLEFMSDFLETNHDDDGDEMFHDHLDLLFEVQEVELGYGSIHRDKFRPLAKQFHGDKAYLHHLSIPQDEFREFIKLILFGGFGRAISPIEQISDLDAVADIVVAPFIQNPDIGITWDMFDHAFRITPGLFDAITRLFSTLFYAPPTEDIPLPKPGKIATVPILSQLSFLDWDIEEALTFTPKSYNPNTTQLTATSLKDQIIASPTPLLLLFSGKIASTGEKTLFGYAIPYLAPTFWHCPCLFQLSPTYDVFRTRITEVPRFVEGGDNLVLGKIGNGVSLRLNGDCTRVTLSHCVSGQKEPMYATTQVRGNWEVEIEVEEIEIWTNDLNVNMK